MPPKQRLQAKSAFNPITASASSYQNSFSVVVHDRGRVSARQPRYFLLRRQKTSTQRKGDPTVRVPALRSGQTCVTPFSLRCGKTRFALRAPLKHVAASQITMHWHSSVPMPAARTACRRRGHTGRCGIGRPARCVTKSGSSAYLDCGSSYQKHKEAIPHPLLPLVPTPATASSWGWQLHRRVQLHRHPICGNLFERSVEDAK